MPGNVCAMTILDPAADLAGGAIALPGDDGYDAARQIFNLALEQRPAAVAFPSDADEVADVVRWARDRGLRVSGAVDRPQRRPARLARADRPDPHERPRRRRDQSGR